MLVSCCYSLRAPAAPSAVMLAVTFLTVTATLLAVGESLPTGGGTPVATADPGSGKFYGFTLGSFQTGITAPGPAPAVASCDGIGPDHARYAECYPPPRTAVAHEVVHHDDGHHSAVAHEVVHHDDGHHSAVATTRHHEPPMAVPPPSSAHHETVHHETVQHHHHHRRSASEGPKTRDLNGSLIDCGDALAKYQFYPKESRPSLLAVAPDGSTPVSCLDALKAYHSGRSRRDVSSKAPPMLYALAADGESLVPCADAVSHQKAHPDLPEPRVNGSDKLCREELARRRIEIDTLSAPMLYARTDSGRIPCGDAIDKYQAAANVSAPEPMVEDSDVLCRDALARLERAKRQVDATTTDCPDHLQHPDQQKLMHQQQQQQQQQQPQRLESLARLDRARRQAAAADSTTECPDGEHPQQPKSDRARRDVAMHGEKAITEGPEGAHQHHHHHHHHQQQQPQPVLHVKMGDSHEQMEPAKSERVRRDAEEGDAAPPPAAADAAIDAAPAPNKTISARPRGVITIAYHILNNAADVAPLDVFRRLLEQLGGSPIPDDAAAPVAVVAAGP